MDLPWYFPLRYARARPRFMAFHESGEMVTHRTSSSLLSSIKKGKLEGCREKLCIPRPINVHMKRSSLFVFFFCVQKWDHWLRLNSADVSGIGMFEAIGVGTYFVRVVKYWNWVEGPFSMRHRSSSVVTYVLIFRDQNLWLQLANNLSSVATKHCIAEYGSHDWSIFPLGSCSSECVSPNRSLYLDSRHLAVSHRLLRALRHLHQRREYNRISTHYKKRLPQKRHALRDDI